MIWNKKVLKELGKLIACVFTLLNVLYNFNHILASNVSFNFEIQYEFNYLL